jgi:phosphoribosylformylglycinamidine synthase
MARVKVTVTLKPSLLDAQGKVVQGALQQLGYEGVEQVRIGKYIELTVDDSANIDAQVKEMCDKLLANPVIEDYQYEVVSAA